MLQTRTGCSLDMHEGFPSSLPDRILTVGNHETADLDQICIQARRCLIEIMQCLKSKALFSFKLKISSESWKSHSIDHLTSTWKLLINCLKQLEPFMRKFVYSHA